MAELKLEYAPEVEKVAKKLIQKHHPHLIEANIIYLFRRGTWTSRRKACFGNAEKANPKLKYLTDGTDFIITIHYETWQMLPPSAREALVDHQLCHCSRGDDDKHGNPTWYIEPHTVEDFAAIIRRHGLWAEDLKMIVRALEANKTHQTELFTEYNYEQSASATCSRAHFDPNDCPEACADYVRCRQTWAVNKEVTDHEQEDLGDPTEEDGYDHQEESSTDPSVMGMGAGEAAASQPLF